MLATVANLDVQRLSLFVGFITIVRYNSDLFEIFPNSLRMLRRAELELTVFREHFMAHRGRSKDPLLKIEQALETFSVFTRSKRGRSIEVFRHILRHERCQWMLRRQLESSGRPVIRAYEGFEADAIPTSTGPMQLLKLGRDPHSVLEALDQDRPLASVPRKPQWLLYCGEPDQRVLSCMPISRGVASVVRLIDGSRSCAEIAAVLARTRSMMPTGVHRVLNALCDARLIVYAVEVDA